MGKVIDTFGRLKFWLPQKQLFQTKTCAAGRVSKTEVFSYLVSFVCHGDF